MDTDSGLIKSIPDFTGDANIDKIFAEAASNCDIEPHEIEAVHPCTTLQHTVVETALKDRTLSVGQSLFTIHSGVDLDRLAEVWERVTQSAPIFRTRILRLPSVGYAQVVLKRSFIWNKHSSIDTPGCAEAERKLMTGDGAPSLRYAIIGDPTTGNQTLCWTFSYAALDETMHTLVLQKVEEAYHGVFFHSEQLHGLVNRTQHSQPAEFESLWSEYCKEWDAATYPVLNSPSYTPNPKAITTIQRISFSSATTPEFSRTTIARAALGILLSHYTNSVDVIFGSIVRGLQLANNDSFPNLSPTNAAIPVRIVFEPNQSVASLLGRIEEHTSKMRPYEQTGLHNIRKLGGNATAACDFQTILSIREGKGGVDSRLLQPLTEFDNFALHGKYAVLLDCHISDISSTLRARHDPSLISEQQMERFLRQLGKIMQQLTCQRIDQSVEELDIASDNDLDEVMEWNSASPKVVNKCIHEVIEAWCITNPNDLAVSAWDGDFTYSELNDISTRLAQHLVIQGLQAGQTVPICFEKSAWTQVAMLAILKAGATFVLLDMTYPPARMAEICRRVSATMAVVSEKNKETLGDVVSVSISLTKDFIKTLPRYADKALNSVRPESVAYIVFTSGSSGEPKGAMIEHRGFVSCALVYMAEMGMEQHTRGLQFASYAFSACLFETLGILLLGGCVCVPSDADRVNDIAGFIRSKDVTWALFTPSFLTILRPETVPSLRVVVTGGEPITMDAVNSWVDRVCLISAYGQSECATICSCAPAKRSSPRNFGRGSGARLWITKPSDSNRLTGVGCIGELVVESPGVARGYLGAPVKASSAFISPPRWSNQDGLAKFYRTGDLVRYENDGTIVYIGRKDSQVKIRGQRVELSEIEYHVRQFVPAGTKVIAETARRLAMLSSTVLIVYLSGWPQSDQLRNTPSGRFGAAAVEVGVEDHLNNKLSNRLPAYFIPSKYVRLEKFPTTASGKMDRMALRVLGGNILDTPMMQTDSDPEGQHKNISETELLLQKAWNRTFGLPEERNIKLDSNFFQNGGDSLLAIKLVDMARQVGLRLTVADVFRMPKFTDMATVLKKSAEDATESTHPEFWMPDEIERDEMRRQAAFLCHLDPELIEDVYPCTELQVGLMALTMKQSQSQEYVARYELRIAKDIDLNKFRAAWDAVVQLSPSLRTRIIQISGRGCYQAVIKEAIDWIPCPDVNSYIEAKKTKVVDFGRSLTSYAIVGENGNTETRFLWTVHHAVLDRWSLRLVVDSVAASYWRKPLVCVLPFKLYIKHLMQNKHQSWVQFWSSQFRGIDFSHFPTLPPCKTVQANSRAETFCSLQLGSSSSVTKASAVRAAWALVVARHLPSSDIVFGCTVSGRSAPIVGVDRIIGPTIATVPVRIVVDESQPVNEYLNAVQQQAAAMIPFEHDGLEQIAQVSVEAREACNFRTLLVVQSEYEDLDNESGLGIWSEDAKEMEINTYPLFLQCFLQPHGILLTAKFDLRAIEAWQMERILKRLSNVIQQLTDAHEGSILAEIDLMSEEDLSQIREWNAGVTLIAARETCVHELIMETVQRSPNSPAICAWDGELTYAELDALSTRLACQLADLGVGPDVIVPLCFEKSMLMPVAMLGVMKAGGASAALDMNLPEERLRSTLRQVVHLVVLSSSTCQVLARRLSQSAVVVVNAAELRKSAHRQNGLSFVSPNDPLYIVYTSGSTGIQKGVIITHSNFSSALQLQSQSLGFRQSSRVLDFASYAFDMAWYNALHTFYAGGCLCIPSEEEKRNSLAQAIVHLKVNFANLTPTVAETLDSATISTLHTLQLAGEAVKRQTFVRLSALTNVSNTYGPAECSAIVVSAAKMQSEYDIGVGIGARSWVVSPTSAAQLCPPGSVGELWIEGPLVGKGYLNNAQQTDVAFVNNPAWLLRSGLKLPAWHGRLYKTGDLVRYRRDGSLDFIGRMDGQVKIRGQRVELSEIEHHVLRMLGREDAQVVAEVITPKDSEKPTLVVFVSLAGRDEQEGKERVAKVTAQLPGQLAAELPTYMIPSAYIAITAIPTTATGKTNRRRLREIGSTYTADDLVNATQDAKAERREPSTLVEKELQRLWASILGIPAHSIGADDSFMRLGGDSIQAMRLVAAVRDLGRALTVADVFKQPRLSKLAQVMMEASVTHGREVIEPFSLLDAGTDVTAAREHAAALCGIEPAQVENVLPCTPLQEGLLAMTAKRAGDYVGRHVFELQPTANVARFQAAWEETMETIPILRTRIIDMPEQGLVQVVVNEKVQWTSGDDLEEYMVGNKEQPMGLGTVLTRQAIVTNGREHRRWFVWTSHHALYDAWSTSLMRAAVENIYNGAHRPRLESFDGFLKWVQEIDEAEAAKFWQRQFAGAEGEIFPTLPSTTYHPRADRAANFKIRRPDDLTSEGVTLATAVRTAWAIVQSQYTNASEAVFGSVVAGRQVPIDKIDRIAGPTIANIPVRVKVDHEATVAELLRCVQRQASDIGPYEQTGLQRIRRVSDEAARCCDFQTLLVVQRAPEQDGATEGKLFVQRAIDEELENNDNANAFNTYALMIEVWVTAQGPLHMRVSFDSQMLTDSEVARIAGQLEHALQQLCTADNATIQLCDIEWISPSELQEIRQWNSEMPLPVETSVHHLVTEVARQQPDDLAICAWDGQLTCRELDELSTQLAQQLGELGVKAGEDTIVPLCFGKSKWLPVAMLGVMKAGGAFCPIDSQIPQTRCREIIRQTTASIVLLGPGAATNMGDLCRTALTLPQDLQKRRTVLDEAFPLQGDRMAYVMYTSGSTGQAKGVAVSQFAASTSILAHGRTMGYNKSTRHLQFSSIGFDASIAEILTTLVFAGTVCIPSEADKLNNLARFIRDEQVNMAFFTPSVLKTLSPAEVTPLRTVVCGGESVERDLAELWSRYLTFIHAYGPTETCVYCVASYITPNDGGRLTLGRAFCGATWIVDTVNGRTLVSIGATGELVIESHTLALGYLHNPEQTAAAFVDDPAWLPCDRSKDQHARFYRTGDLVRYCDEHGNLEYVGRKDRQVKLRGQRIELSEVEYHVLRLLRQLAKLRTEENDGQANAVDIEATMKARIVAEVVKPQNTDQPMLVAFINLPEVEVYGGTSRCEHELQKEVERITQGLSDNLAAEVPSYMIPSAYFGISEVPMTETGKTDRRRLCEIGLALIAEDLVMGTRPHADGIAPSNTIEQLLHDVWKLVLNIPASTSVSIDAAFTRLGGDSITAMQVAARCRRQNLHVSVNDILSLRTIKEIARNCQLVNPRRPEVGTEEVAMVEEESAGAWILSPIQRMFFAANPGGCHHFNQSFMLRLRRHIPVESLRAAILAVAQRHAMLRARFRISRLGEWEQYVAGNAEDASAFAAHAVSGVDKIEGIAQTRQRALNIQRGPVFAVDVFEMDEQDQIVLLSAHHLVVDLVSWRILWQDMQECLRDRPLEGAPTPFRTWCKAQWEISKSFVPDERFLSTFQPSQLTYWGVGKGENESRLHDMALERLDSKTTSLLLGTSNEAFRTEPIDILLAVLLYTFQKIFSDRQAPTVFVEGHGRELIEGLEMDVSETVGWFTSLHPLQLPTTSSDALGDIVRVTKDLRRKGLRTVQAHFACQSYEKVEDNDVGVPFPSEVLLNYTGLFQQLEDENALFASLGEIGAAVHFDQLSPDAQRFGLVEVNVAVVDKSMQISFSFNKRMRQQSRLRQWRSMYTDELKNAARMLAERRPRYTLSDFPLLSMSYPGLDDLIETQLDRAGVQRDEILGIYPCTALQEGILFSKKRGTASYANHWIWECRDIRGDAGSKPSSEQLERAWQMVINRHSIFSTVFIDNIETGGFLQAILSPAKVRPRIKQISSGADAPEQALRALSLSGFQPLEPEFAVTICKGEDGDIACRLDMSHALVDAASVPTLLRDLEAAYRKDELHPAPQFLEAVRHIERTPKQERLQFWRNFLKDVEPCCLRSRRETGSAKSELRNYRMQSVNAARAHEIYQFCKDKGITRATFMQVAWALVLSRYTTASQVCFGYLASGRDMPIDNVYEIVGPLINMLVSRIDLDGTVDVALETTSRNLAKHFAYQHTSLAEIHHALDTRGRPLFNTVITVREVHEQAQGSETLRLRELSDSDPHEYDLVLAVGLEETTTRVALSYPEDGLGTTMVLDVEKTLKSAIEYILSRSTTEQTDLMKTDRERVGMMKEGGEIQSPRVDLRRDFFRFHVGVEGDEADAYWKAQLSGAEGAVFPALPSSMHQSRPDTSITANIRAPEWPKREFTVATMVLAAWAILQARYIDTDEAVFGATGKMRLTTVPVRVLVDREATVEEFLRRIHDQKAGMTPFERTGLERIRQVSEEAHRCCEFQTLLVVNPEADRGLLTQPTANARGTSDRESPYAMVVEVDVLTFDSLRICVSFDSRIMVEERVNRTMQQLEHILRQMSAAGVGKTKMKIGELGQASEKELGKIWAWNATVPASVDLCVHDLITQTALQHPGRIAVEACDGQLTYKELDTLSTYLAHQLVAAGVAPEVQFGHVIQPVVPLVFEKSMWTPVAMLGVMKAGGVTVALDVTQPENRLLAIVQQAAPSGVVSSLANRKLAHRLAQDKPVLLVSRDLLSPAAMKNDRLPSNITPSHAMCAVFTSGSTGTPKGALLTHRNFSSALSYHREVFGVTKTSRVYDFASYSFDFAWHNFLLPAACGGCICIPSEEERKGDVVESLARHRATVAFFTPSLALALDFSRLVCLETLLLGGEALRNHGLLLPSKCSRVINIYGPAECTVMATCNDIPIDQPRAGSIGLGVGTNTWIVDPEYPDRLVPVGWVGELWLEGPLVGQGYLSNAEQTEAAFVEDPTWLSRGASGISGRRGRLYRTGDLVRYRDRDGSLEFLGRKDEQVKVRGQRVELFEVERHIRLLLQPIVADTQVVAEVVSPRDTNRPLLVAFIALPGDEVGPDSFGDEQNNGRKAISKLAKFLHRQLRAEIPAYMVPAAYIPINTVPRTVTGKIDRRHLRMTASSWTLDELMVQTNASSSETIIAPSSPYEQTLCDIWATTLDIPAESISMDKAFADLGGDSISAMLVVAKCRQKGIHLNVGDLLKYQTIKELSLRSELATAPATEMEKAESTMTRQDSWPETLGLRFGLSPIQQMYFDFHPDDDVCFDQCFLLRVKRRVSYRSLRNSLQSLVSRHSMLRARYERPPGGSWVQYLTDNVESSVNTECFKINGESELASIIAECRGRLNIKTGPLVSTALIEAGGSQIVLISIHHLVVDFMSWRILLNELDDLLSDRPLNPMHSTNFQWWCIAQQQYAVENLPPEVALPNPINPPSFDYWGLTEEHVGRHGYVERSFTLGRDVSSGLLGNCNEMFQTKPLELMMAVLLYSFRLIFADRSLPACFNEGHGREPWDESIDLSQTVGWFTTISPVQVDSSGDTSLYSMIQSTKTSLRSLPKNGWSYFASRYHNPLGREQFKTSCIELNFNYLGAFQQLESSSSLFQQMEIPDMSEPGSASRGRLFSVLDVLAINNEGILKFLFRRDKLVRQHHEIDRWIDTFERSLIEAVESLR